MAGRLQGKIAVITGSSSGIGRAIALAYAREGATIVCSDIQENAINVRPEASDLTTTQELDKLGAKSIYVKCDTRISEEVEGLIKKAVEEFGRVDIMVNNAGIGGSTPQPIWEFSEEYFDKTISINLRGVFLGIKYAAKQMVTQDPHPSGDRGWIINLASVLGLNGISNATAYVASKHGVIGLTKTAAWDCAPQRIHVNALCPGFTQTSMIQPLLDSGAGARLQAMHPFRGLGTAEDIARAAVFMGSEDASWVTGVGLPVDGGYNAI
jgi:NAD(P)-dependent dehydrogenase (short-subunit alcohol dehydrogenase family)